MFKMFILGGITMFKIFIWGGISTENGQKSRFMALLTGLRKTNFHPYI